MVGVISDREARLVKPFYLEMMQLNAIRHGADLASAIVTASRAADRDDIVALLRGDWRPNVMGAWLSLARNDLPTSDEVLSSLGRSYGSLTSPPLAVAAVVLANERALPALRGYVDRDQQGGWGAAPFAKAAIRFLGGATERDPSEAVDLNFQADTADVHFRAMLEVAMLLRRAGSSPT